MTKEEAQKIIDNPDSTAQDMIAAKAVLAPADTASDKASTDKTTIDTVDASKTDPKDVAIDTTVADGPVIETSPNNGGSVDGATAPSAHLPAPVVRDDLGNANATEEADYKPKTLTDELTQLQEGKQGAAHGVYEELKLIIAEAKYKVNQVAAKLADEEDHIVHDIKDQFSRL